MWYNIFKSLPNLSMGLFVMLIFHSCDSPQKKTVKEEYNGNWVEFWDNADINDKENVAIIQTINENNTPPYDHHYKKASSISKGKYLLALKNDDLKEWDYYYVWIGTHKIEGPFKNDSDLVPPNI